MSEEPPRHIAWHTDNAFQNMSPFRHILVALDVSTQAGAVLETAAQIAATMEAELSGLFVEDVRLLALEDHPMTHGVHLPWADASAPGSLEREMRAMATRTRQMLAAASRRRRVRWSFNVVRGDVGAEITAAAARADLLLLERRGRPFTRYASIPSRLAHLAIQAPQSLMLLQSESAPRRPGPVILGFGNFPHAEKALHVAAGLVSIAHPELVIALLGSDGTDFSYTRKWLRGWLRERGLRARLTRMSGSTSSGIGGLSRRLDAGLVVLSAASPAVSEAAIEALFQRSNAPILLVR